MASRSLLALKIFICFKRGHKRQDRVRYGLRRATGYRIVAEEVIEESSHCRRCGAVLLEPRVKFIHSISSLTMDEDMWRTVDRDGVVWRDHA